MMTRAIRSLTDEILDSDKPLSDIDGDIDVNNWL